MSLHDAMRDACADVGIEAPHRTKIGQWVPCPVQGKAKSNKSGRVLIFDGGDAGMVWNHVTGQNKLFKESGSSPTGKVKSPRRDFEAERRAGEEQAEVARICRGIVKAATPQPHPYFAAKGFPDEVGLVIDDVRPLIPDHDLGRAMIRALPQGEGPWLIVPGRVAQHLTTVQIIGPDGEKKNILRGKMSGASHRIATGRETWVCEGIATALTVRAALRLLGRSATVLSAFSAANVTKVARLIGNSIIAADHDAPQDALGGKGAGEHHAALSGCAWRQPPDIGDWNDYHQAHGLRAVALELRKMNVP